MTDATPLPYAPGSIERADGLLAERDEALRQLAAMEAACDQWRAKFEAERRVRGHRVGERDSARADRDRFAATLIAIRDDSPSPAKAKRMASDQLKGWPHEPMPHQLHICEEDGPAPEPRS